MNQCPECGLPAPRHLAVCSIDVPPLGYEAAMRIYDDVRAELGMMSDDTERWLLGEDATVYVEQYRPPVPPPRGACST